MSAHTPGPWFAGRHVSGNGIAIHVDTVSAGLVASVGDHDARCGGLHAMYASRNYEGHARIETLAANARLIAAAPELLDALQPFVAHNSSDDTITITVRTEDVRRARAAIAKATQP